MSSSNGESVVDESMEIGDQDNNWNKNETNNENKTHDESGTGSSINENISENIENTVRENSNENKNEIREEKSVNANENISENIENNVRENSNENKNEIRQGNSVNSNGNVSENIENPDRGSNNENKNKIREGTSVNANENISENIENPDRGSNNENKNKIREGTSVNANENISENIENSDRESNNGSSQNVNGENRNGQLNNIPGPIIYPLPTFRPIPPDIYIWDRKANTCVRKFLLRESALKKLEPILTYYWKQINKSFHEDVLRHYNLCLSLTRNILKICFFTKSLLTANNSSLNYTQISFKLCDILVNYTEIQLRIAFKLENSSMSVASKITNAYDVLLGSANKSLILQVLLQIRHFNKQYELLSRIFSKYIKKNQKNMSDRLYLLHLFALRKWKSLLADNSERDKISEIAYSLKPIRPISENYELLQLLNIDRFYYTDERSILDYIFSRQNYKHSVYWNLITGNELNAESVVFNLTEDDDEILDQLQYTFPYGDNNEIIVEEPQFPSIIQNQEINRVQVKMEQPKVIDIIDLTIEERDDLFYIKILIKNANRAEIRSFTVTGTIVLDDDKVEPIPSTSSNIVEPMEVVNQICNESNVNCDNNNDDNNSKNFEESEIIYNVEKKENVQKKVDAAAENVEVGVVCDSNRNLCEYIEAININSEDQTQLQQEHLKSTNIENIETVKEIDKLPLTNENEKSISVQNEKPMSTQNEESISIQNEESISSQNEESLSLQNEKPMSTQNEESLSIQNEESISSQNEESLSLQNEKPMTTQNKESISIQNEEPVSTQNEESISIQNEESISSQNEESLSLQNEKPMSTQNEESLSMQNEKPMSTQNEGPLAIQNEEPMNIQNEESISMQNEKPMSTQNEGSLTIQNKEPMSTQNEEPMSTSNEILISTQNEESLSMQNEKPMTTQNEELLSIQNEERMTTQNEELLSMQNEKPMSTQNEGSLTIQNEEPMSTQNEEPMSTQNEEPMSTSNEILISTQNEESISTQNEKPMTTQNKESISIQNEEPVSTQNEESLSMQNEKPMTTRNEESISIQNEEGMSTQNEESLSIQHEELMSTQNEESMSTSNEILISTQIEESISTQNVELISTSNEESLSIQNKEPIILPKSEKEISLPQSLQENSQLNNVESDKDDNDIENLSNINNKCENDKQNTDEFLCNSLEEEKSLTAENNASLDVHNFLFKDILQTNVCNSELNESITVQSSEDRIHQQSSPDLYLFRDHQEDLDNYSTTVVDKPNLYDDKLSEEYDDEIKSIAEKITIPVLKTYERKKKSQITNKTIEIKTSNDANNIQITHNTKNLHMVDNTNLQFEQTTHIKDNIGLNTNIGLDPPVFSPFSSEESSRSSSPIDILSESVNQDINNLENDMIIPLIKNTTNKNVHSENNVVFSAVATKRLEVKKWKDPMEMSSNVSAQPNIIFSTDRFSTLQQKEFNQISKIYDNVPVEKAPHIVETIIHSQEECDEIRSPPVECFTESDAHEICDLIGKDWSDSNLNKHRKNTEELRKSVYYKQDDEYRRFNSSIQSTSQNLDNIESRENQVYNLNINEDLTPNDLSTRTLKRKSVTFADTTQERNIRKIIDNPPTSQILDRKTYEPVSVQQIPEWNSPINKTFNQSTHYHSLPTNQHSTLPINQSNSIFQHLDTSSNYDAPPKSLSTSNANSGTKNLEKLCKTMDIKSHSRNSNNRTYINNINNHISSVKNFKNKNEIVLRSNNWKLTNVSISKKNSIQYDNIFSSKSNNFNLNKTVINKNDNSVNKDMSNNLSKKISNENRTTQNTSNVIDNKMVSDFDKYLRSKKNLKSNFKEKSKLNKHGRKSNMNIQNKKLKNNKKTSDISKNSNLSLKKLLYSFQDEKLLKKSFIKLLPIEYDSSLSSLEIVSSFKKNILNKDCQVNVLNNYDNTNNLSKMISNHVFIQDNKRKNSQIVNNENYHSFVKLKRIKLISNDNNDDNNQQKNIDKNSTNNEEIKGQEEDNNQNQNPFKRYDNYKNNCNYNISNIDSLVKDNNNIINRECNYDIDTSVSSSVFHYSIDQNERYEDVNDREDVYNMNIEEEDSVSMSETSNFQISSNINSKTKNIIHNNYDDIIHENEVSSSQDTSGINNDIDDINNVVSSSTVEQSEFLQNNQVDSSNPSILHRISGGTRRKTILIDHNDLSTNNTIKSINESNEDATNNTPTTTTKDVDKSSQNRKRGRPKKYNKNINDNNTVEKQDMKLLSKTEKIKLTNMTDKNNSFSYLSKNYLTKKKTNSQKTKTYSNCHIQKIFVPPEVEQIIEENVSKNETTKEEIPTVKTTKKSSSSSSSSVFGFSSRRKYRYK